MLKKLKNCYCEVKPQNHNVADNLNWNLWAISGLATKQLQIWCLQKIYHVDIRTPFQLVFLPNTHEAYSMNMYIPATPELTNNDPTVTVHNYF